MSVVSRAELSEALEGCRQRREFWELRARVAEVRVAELEDAIKDHQRHVAADKAERVAFTGSDRVLWKLVGR